MGRYCGPSGAAGNQWRHLGKGRTEATLHNIQWSRLHPPYAGWIRPGYWIPMQPRVSDWQIVADLDVWGVSCGWVCEGGIMSVSVPGVGGWWADTLLCSLSLYTVAETHCAQQTPTQCPSGRIGTTSLGE